MTGIESPRFHKTNIVGNVRILITSNVLTNIVNTFLTFVGSIGSYPPPYSFNTI